MSSTFSPEYHHAFVARCAAITPRWREVRGQFTSDEEFIELLPYVVRDPYSPIFVGKGSVPQSIYRLWTKLISARQKRGWLKFNDPEAIENHKEQLSHDLRRRAYALRAKAPVVERAPEPQDDDTSFLRLMRRVRR